MQTIVKGPNCHLSIDEFIQEADITKLLLVHDDAYKSLPIHTHLNGVPHAVFSGFTSNPRYEDICIGVECFYDNACDGILAVGGGSAIDVAKCIKHFSGVGKDYLNASLQENSIPLIVIPTTAGTGSESTHFTVFYVQGKKHSIAHKSLLPDIAFLDATMLQTLPFLQKKYTFWDALCQGIESLWSIKSTHDSAKHAETAIRELIVNMDIYFDGWNVNSAQCVLEAANYAGQAINLTQTTAPHAMSYKLTTLYGIPHGGAVAMCLPEVWAFMLEHPERCVHPDGYAVLQKVFTYIAFALGQPSAEAAVIFLKGLREKMALGRPHTHRKEDILLLAQSVNTQRLSNNPIWLDTAALQKLYEQIVVIE